MVWRCVAAGCSKTHKDGVSLFLFPKEPTLRKKWAAQVRRTRDKWEPTDSSVVCSKHFEDHCFEQDNKIALAMGLNKRKPRLMPNALPTLFEKPVNQKRSSVSDISQVPSTPKRGITVFENRERSRVSLSYLIALFQDVTV